MADVAQDGPGDGRGGGPPTGHRGPRGARGEVRRRITDAAVRSFADHGLDGSSARSIARDADCDPALVRYYFTSKEALFELVTRRPEALDRQLATMAGLPHDDRAPFLAGLVEDCWDDPATSDFWRSLLRSSRTDAGIARQVEDAWADFVALGMVQGGGDAGGGERPGTWPAAVADGVVGGGDGTGPEGGTTGAVHGPDPLGADRAAAGPLTSRHLVDDEVDLPDEVAALPAGPAGPDGRVTRGADAQQRSVTALTSIMGMLAAVHLWSSGRATALDGRGRAQALESVLATCFRPPGG